MFWRRNGKILTRNGKFINCGDCPCFCKGCGNIEKAYLNQEAYLGHIITEYRDSDYEEFTESYERSGYIRFNGQEGVDWGVFAFAPVYYPSDDPEVTIIDARSMSQKYGRKGCYYQYETGCEWFGNYLYPDCKTRSSFFGYRNYKKFDITLCVDTYAYIEIGISGGRQFSYTTSCHPDCGDADGKLFMDGKTYIDNYVPSSGGMPGHANGTFDLPGYTACYELDIDINDNRDHAGNNYSYGGPHNYHLVFYLPIVIDDSSSSIQEQEDDIQ